jgi:hypothetical protein
VWSCGADIASRTLRMPRAFRKRFSPGIVAPELRGEWRPPCPRPPPSVLPAAVGRPYRKKHGCEERSWFLTPNARHCGRRPVCNCTAIAGAGTAQSEPPYVAPLAPPVAVASEDELVARDNPRRRFLVWGVGARGTPGRSRRSPPRPQSGPLPRADGGPKGRPVPHRARSPLQRTWPPI